MLTKKEKVNTSIELKANFSLLNQDIRITLDDLCISEEELNDVLEMKSENPGYVWMVRDYLEDKLKENDIEMCPFSKLADYKSNKWFKYEHPWKARN